MPSGFTVTRLSVTPVKGLSLHHPESIELTTHGVLGDRMFYLVDDSGKLQSCTANPGLYGLVAMYDAERRHLEVSRGDELLLGGTVEPGGAVYTDLWGLRTIRSDVVADPVWSSLFSDVVGRHVQLAHARRSAYDVHPATLLGESSVHELARRACVPAVDSRRFRMLIEFAGGEPHAEDSWEGRLLEIGGAILRARGPVKRCATTTRDPGTGTVDLQTLRLITAYRGRQDSVLGPGAMFGIYADVVGPGTVSVGDTLGVRTDT
jgi:MOSC domain-containing protein